MTRLADEAGVPSVPHVIGRAGSYDELLALAQSAGLGDDLVIEAAYGNAGSGTFFVRGQRDWDHYAGDLVGQELKVMKRIRNVEVCLEGTVTRHGTVIGPAMTSLVGYPELTPSKGGWCGNDIWREVLPPAQTHAAREMVRKLGDVLRREGYRGYFEVDLLHDLDSDELYLGEVNPRLSGASPMTNLTTEAYADMPLFLFHLLEYMDVEYELDIEEINSRWERGYGEDEVWGQLIITETSPDVELFTATPRTGVWRLDDDGRVSFARSANDWATLLDESEAFYMRVAAPGDFRCRGRRTRRARHPRAPADRRLPAHRALPALGQGHQGAVRLNAPGARPRRSSRGSSHEREQRLHQLPGKPGIERDRQIQAFLRPPRCAIPATAKGMGRCTPRLAPRPRRVHYGEVFQAWPALRSSIWTMKGLATDVWPIFGTDPWRKAIGAVSEQSGGSNGIRLVAWAPEGLSQHFIRLRAHSRIGGLVESSGWV